MAANPRRFLEADQERRGHLIGEFTPQYPGYQRINTVFHG